MKLQELATPMNTSSKNLSNIRNGQLSKDSNKRMVKTSKLSRFRFWRRKNLAKPGRVIKKRRRKTARVAETKRHMMTRNTL